MVNGLKVEDRLDGAANYTSWKFRVLIVLEENNILNYMKSVVDAPSDDSEKAQWRKNNFMARKILIDYVKDHLVPVISKLDSTEEMFECRQSLYEFNSISRALALRRQLFHIKMARGEFVVSFFMKITKLKDQLNTIGDSIEDKDLVMLAMNGFPHSWESFIQGISGRNELPKFDRLRVDCIQGECRLEARGFGCKTHHEEDYVFVAHTSKRKGRKRNFKRNKDRNSDLVPKSKKKKELSRVQCFRCDNDTWLIDSGASRHITGYCEHLSNMKGKDSHLQVIIGDDASYSVKGVGSTSFRLD
ncbi:uncharacterized protein LOC131876712 [Cryptomeria japonica]|uniref:uncharacterized protein LOC131876712 n=1 Tax=Cryptomeria japonica TaxID=3369 RepID=UPI0027DA4D82|nr:uncharacterized protein LOC131876712 [Cryptomeria japonica]